MLLAPCFPPLAQLLILLSVSDKQTLKNIHRLPFCLPAWPLLVGNSLSLSPALPPLACLKHPGTVAVHGSCRRKMTCVHVSISLSVLYHWQQLPLVPKPLYYESPFLSTQFLPFVSPPLFLSLFLALSPTHIHTHTHTFLGFFFPMPLGGQLVNSV